MLFVSCESVLLLPAEQVAFAEPDDEMTSRREMTRRGWMTGMIAAAGASLAAIVGIPSLLFSLTPVLNRRKEHVWSPIGSLDAFALDGVHKVLVDVPADEWPDAFETIAVYVWRAAVDEVVVFSRACTDLGCPITWDSGSEWFFCPCHGGIFGKDGTPKAGPPPRSLYRYATRVRDGVVEIDLNSLPARASSTA